MWRDVDYYIFWNSFEILCGLRLQVSQLRNQLYFMIRGVERLLGRILGSQVLNRMINIYNPGVSPKVCVIAGAAEWLRARALNQAY